MKFTKTNEKQLREFMNLMDTDGCVPVTEWTSGSGRHTTARALPPFVKRYERTDLERMKVSKHGTPDRSAYVYFKAYPRRKAVLVLDMDAMFNFLFDSANCKEVNL